MNLANLIQQLIPSPNFHDFFDKFWMFIKDNRNLKISEQDSFSYRKFKKLSIRLIHGQLKELPAAQLISLITLFVVSVCVYNVESFSL